MYSPPAFLVISKLLESGILNDDIKNPIPPKITAGIIPISGFPNICPIG